MSTASPEALADAKPKPPRRQLRWVPVAFVVFVPFLSVPIGMGVFMMVGVIDDANVGKAKADVKTIETNIIRYKSDTNLMPTSLLDLAVHPADMKGPWRKMMEEAALKDAWGNDYRYLKPGKHNKDGFDVFSLGPDMKEGTEDDIGNWSAD